MTQIEKYIIFMDQKNQYSENEVLSDSWPPHGLQPAGSSVHGIFQVTVLEWGVIAFSKNIF